MSDYKKIMIDDRWPAILWVDEDNTRFTIKTDLKGEYGGGVIITDSVEERAKRRFSIAMEQLEQMRNTPRHPVWYRTWQCQNCGESIGYLGRFFQWLLPEKLHMHKCDGNKTSNSNT